MNAHAYANAQEQIPVLCGQCLGPTNPGPHGTMHCPFCGNVESLPADELQRVMQLKQRLRQAANTVAQVRGAEAALGSVFEDRMAFVRVAGLFGALFLATVCYTVFSVWDHVQSAPVSVRASLLINASLGPLMIGGFALSLCVALAVARFQYRRRVRPQMFARAPRVVGSAARCRACGGDLPSKDDAFTACGYCGTHNLVTKELQQEREQRLAAERAFYQARSGRVLAATTAQAPNTGRILVVCCVIVYATVIGMAHLSNALLTQSM